jgi:hypothetical protein
MAQVAPGGELMSPSNSFTAIAANLARRHGQARNGWARKAGTRKAGARKAGTRKAGTRKAGTRKAGAKEAGVGGGEGQGVGNLEDLLEDLGFAFFKPQSGVASLSFLAGRADPLAAKGAARP